MIFEKTFQFCPPGCIAKGTYLDLIGDGSIVCEITHIDYALEPNAVQISAETEICDIDFKDVTELFQSLAWAITSDTDSENSSEDSPCT